MLPYRGRAEPKPPGERTRVGRVITQSQLEQGPQYALRSELEGRSKRALGRLGRASEDGKNRGSNLGG